MINANTVSMPQLGNIFTVMVIMAIAAGAGYFVYLQVAESAVNQNADQSASDLDIVLEDLNINFSKMNNISGIEKLKADLQEIDSLESIEIRI